MKLRAAYILTVILSLSALSSHADELTARQKKLCRDHLAYEQIRQCRDSSAQNLNMAIKQLNELVLVNKAEDSPSYRQECVRYVAEFEKAQQDFERIKAEALRQSQALKEKIQRQNLNQTEAFKNADQATKDGMNKLRDQNKLISDKIEFVGSMSKRFKVIRGNYEKIMDQKEVKYHSGGRDMFCRRIPLETWESASRLENEFDSLHKLNDKFGEELIRAYEQNMMALGASGENVRKLVSAMKGAQDLGYKEDSGSVSGARRGVLGRLFGVGETDSATVKKEWEYSEGKVSGGGTPVTDRNGNAVTDRNGNPVMSGGEGDTNYSGRWDRKTKSIEGDGKVNNDILGYLGGQGDGDLLKDRPKEVAAASPDNGRSDLVQSVLGAADDKDKDKANGVEVHAIADPGKVEVRPLEADKPAAKPDDAADAQTVAAANSETGRTRSTDVEAKKLNQSDWNKYDKYKQETLGQGPVLSSERSKAVYDQYKSDSQIGDALKAAQGNHEQAIAFQHAINDTVMKKYGPDDTTSPSVWVDGDLGRRTATSLDKIMSDPSQKQAFLESLKERGFTVNGGASSVPPSSLGDQTAKTQTTEYLGNGLKLGGSGEGLKLKTDSQDNDNPFSLTYKEKVSADNPFVPPRTDVRESGKLYDQALEDRAVYNELKVKCGGSVSSDGICTTSNGMVPLGSKPGVRTFSQSRLVRDSSGNLIWQKCTVKADDAKSKYSNGSAWSTYCE